MSQAAPFLRVGPIGGVDERVIVLDDHSRRCMADLRRHELGAPPADEGAADVRAAQGLLGVALPGLDARSCEHAGPAPLEPIAVVEVSAP